MHEEVRERLQLNQYGWHMVERAGDFERLDWQPARSARRFEAGSPNMLGIHALEASLSLIEERGVGAIADTVAANISLGMDQIERYGFKLLSPTRPQRRSGILTFRVPGIDQARLHRELMQRGVICAQRGGGIRFSPHFHTAPEVLEKGFAMVKEAAVTLSA